MVQSQKVIDCEENNQPEFFKVFLPGVTDRRLGIPRAFLKYIEDKSSGIVSLMGPSGNVWHVCLVKDVNGLYFQNGWQDFVRDHCLKFGYIMVFRYADNLHFTVQIFDTTGCENEHAFYVESCQDISEFDECLSHFLGRLYSKHKEPTDSSTYMTNSSPSVDTSCLTMNNQVERCLSKKLFSSNKVIKRKASFQDHFNSSVEHNQLAKQQSLSKKPADSTQAEMLKAKRKLRNLQDALNSRIALKSQRREVTEEEVKRTFEEANSFKSKKPFALMVMRRSYVYSGFFLPFPVSFSIAYLPKANQAMILYDPSGKAWSVNYMMNQGRGSFSGGWYAFAYGNNLEKDDACIFELIGRNKLQVHIFRVVKEIIPLINLKRIRRGKQSDD